MLKKHEKSFIINIIGVILVFILISPVIAEDEDVFVIKPFYEFKGGRDLFSPKIERDLLQSSSQVDIGSLKLEGIISGRDIETALFIGKSGVKFGYILRNGEFFRENEKKVEGIKGFIKNANEAVLIQGDKEIVFRLSDEFQQQYIRPE
ncbi:MAG: hypothetical protein ACLFP1_05720 [Candidatus Goldiibacteriota bacterium]